ncbi:MAG: hypothetical protein GX024_05235 [Clostridiales bacterium]|jgi:hypothetical protein|nr:hypothetical protein [Clostridiales bacterium]
MKVIAVQRGLEQIMNQLNKLGYKTVYYDEIDSPVDALVYIQDNDANSLVNINQLLSQQNLTPAYPGSHGTVLINANNKSINDIVQIIENRVYSPLF